MPERNSRATSFLGTSAVRTTLLMNAYELASSEYTNAAVRPCATQWTTLRRKKARVCGVRVIRVNYSK